MPSLTRIIVLIVVLLATAYTAGAYINAGNLTLTIASIGLDGLTINVSNPTMYAYTISEIHITIYVNGERIGELKSVSTVQVEPGNNETVELRYTSVNLKPLLALISSNTVNITAKIHVVASPKLGPVQLPKYSLDKTIVVYEKKAEV